MEVLSLVLIVAVIVLVPVTVGLGLLVRHKSEALDASEGREAGLAVTVERQKAAAAAMVTPLTWVMRGDVSPLARVAIFALFTNVQAIVREDDQEMAKRVEAAPEPPRRLPKYPIVPAYLASPEDVATRGAAQERPTITGAVRAAQVVPEGFVARGVVVHQALASGGRLLVDIDLAPDVSADLTPELHQAVRDLPSDTFGAVVFRRSQDAIVAETIEQAR